MKNISIPQVILLIACLAAPIVAFKLLDSSTAAMATSSVGMLITFALGRPDDSKGEGQ